MRRFVVVVVRQLMLAHVVGSYAAVAVSGVLDGWGWPFEPAATAAWIIVALLAPLTFPVWVAVSLVHESGYSIGSVTTAWAMAAYVGVPGLLYVARNVVPRKRARRLERGLCADCGYDLTGNVSGVCPECGGVVVDGVGLEKRANRVLPGGNR